LDYDNNLSMKARYLISSLLFFSVLASAQDTIFVKGGQVIPVTIIGKDAMELRYKKFGQPGSSAIYSVFISDILSIHYKDGIVADYTSKSTAETKPETPLALAGTMKAAKFSLGVSVNYFKRNQSDNLLLFWKDRTGSSNPGAESNPLYFPINLKMSFPLGNMGRSWMGDDFQLVFTPKDAIHYINASGSSEIMLKAFYANIGLYYGHTLNHKKNLIAIIEPALDIAFMSGFIKINNTKTTISANTGMGFHVALGSDWIISKRLLASIRIGQRFMTIKEQHNISETKFATYYVHPSINDDKLSVKWNGLYASAGLSFNLYAKMKNGQKE
jgi:hypothetical protein